jgi:hypothetical protein
VNARQIVTILAAIGVLFCGGILAIAGNGLGAGVTAAFLIAAPATAVAVSLSALDPLARIVLALVAAIVINALVAETMLVTGNWSIRGGAAVIGVVSALMWLVASAISARSGTPADNEREVLTQAGYGDEDKAQ